MSSHQLSLWSTKWLRNDRPTSTWFFWHCSNNASWSSPQKSNDFWKRMAKRMRYVSNILWSVQSSPDILKSYWIRDKSCEACEVLVSPGACRSSSGSTSIDSKRALAHFSRKKWKKIKWYQVCTVHSNFLWFVKRWTSDLFQPLAQLWPAPHQQPSQSLPYYTCKTFGFRSQRNRKNFLLKHRKSSLEMFQNRTRSSSL